MTIVEGPVFLEFDVKITNVKFLGESLKYTNRIYNFKMNNRGEVLGKKRVINLKGGKIRGKA